MAKDQYTGPLDCAALAAGMNAAQVNARRLTADARLLFEGKRYATTAALCVLAIEEAGKRHVLRELALARDETELRQAWKAYRSHTHKNILWPLFDMLAQGARKASDFSQLFDSNAEHAQILEELKQISFYTDCYRQKHWSVPEEVVSRDLAEGLLQIASNLVPPEARRITAEEMELWIQFMQPVWKTTDELMEKALFDWDGEMRRRGLIPETMTSMKAFFTTGSDLRR
jgi:AbiV family abortive infection protein